MDRDLGLRTQDFILYPSLELGTGYNSNLFYESEDETPIGSPYVHLMPKLQLNNQNTRNLKLDFDANALFNYYTDSNEAVQDQNSLGGEVGVGATFFDAGPVALQLRERFRRAVERRNMESGRNFNRNVNRVGGGLNFRPGGRALEVKADYDFVADLFTDTADDWGDLTYHDMSLRASWKFFPFTALVLDTNWQVRDYLSETGGHYNELTDSKPLKIKAGVNGFITKKLSVLAMVGWGNSFHDDFVQSDTAENDPNQDFYTPDADSSYNGPIADARVSLKLSPTTIVQGGYSYDFNDSLFTNYVAFHEVYGNFQQRIAQRVDFELDVAYQYLMYSQLPAAYVGADPAVTGIMQSGFDRRDQVLKTRATVKVDITRTLAFQALYGIEMNNTLPGAETTAFTLKKGDVQDLMAYTRHFVEGSLILRY